MNHTVGYHAYFETGHYLLFTLPITYGPALANLLTRLITKEGFSEMKLHLRLKGNVKWYFLSWLLMPVLAMISAALLTAFFGRWDFSVLKEYGSPKMIAGSLLFSVGAVPLCAYNTFGEEFGWRGYMNDHMQPILGRIGTIIVGGILWGVWHAPLTVRGHNFGTDYPGFPYTGIIHMAMICTVFGILLMYVTEKTGSVFPAAILHAGMNFGRQPLILFQHHVEPEANPLGAQEWAAYLPLFICAAVLLLLMLRKKKDSPANQ